MAYKDSAYTVVIATMQQPNHNFGAETHHGGGDVYFLFIYVFYKVLHTSMVHEIAKANTYDT